MNYDFGIRVDVGENTGSGHFFRCYSIAEKLIQNGFKVVFIVNNENAIKSHLKEKIPYIVLKSTNELDRINQCKEIAKNISKLIVDLPFKNESYSESLSNHVKTIIIDDIGNKSIVSQLLFNGHIVKGFQNYSIDKKITKYFFGPQYMILRSEFELIRNKINPPDQKIKKILLTFGGNDDNDVTRKILPYFVKKNYEITIVLGPSYKHYSNLEKIIPKNKNFQIIVNEKNVASLFSKQDLVISSSGITVYELACLGIPCILIPSDEYQEKTAIEMSKQGFGKNFGFWDDDFKKLEQFIFSLDGISERKKMHFIGRKLVDGKGLSRVLERIHDL